MGILEYEYRVAANDVGEKNELTNKGFLRLMQEAAINASDSVGYSMNNVNETRLFWVILNWKLKVFSRPNWNSKIIIKTWPNRIFKCYSTRDFEVYDENYNKIGIATSRWVLIDLDTNAIKQIPKALVEQYECVDVSVFDDESFEKIKEPEGAIATFEYKIQRRDIDTNHHVNNINYIDYAYEALPQEVYEACDFTNVEIMYKHAATVGDHIVCTVCKDDNNVYTVTVKNKDSGKVHVGIGFA